MYKQDVDDAIEAALKESPFVGVVALTEDTMSTDLPASPPDPAISGTGKQKTPKKALTDKKRQWRQQITRRVELDMFKNLSEEHKNLVHNRYLEEVEHYRAKKAAIADAQDSKPTGLEHDPKERQLYTSSYYSDWSNISLQLRIISNLTAVMQQACQKISDLCGFSSLFIVGGPSMASKSVFSIQM